MPKIVKEIDDIDVIGLPDGYEDGYRKGFFICFNPTTELWEIRLNGDQSGMRYVAQGRIVADHIEIPEVFEDPDEADNPENGEIKWDHDQEGEVYKVNSTGRRSELLFNCSVNGYVDGLRLRVTGNYLTFYLQCGTVLSADETIPWTASDIYIGANSHPLDTHFILLLDQEIDE